MNKDDLKNFIAEKAKERWERLSEPFLLSQIPSALREENGTDYKTILGEERLKSFVRETQASEYYFFVEHPNQKAKVGVVPPNVDFKFPERETREDEKFKKISSDPARVRNEEIKTIEAFLTLLSKLPDEDLEKVNIPTKVLVKLISQQ